MDSYTNNYDLSYKGECLKCKYNFILNNYFKSTFGICTKCNNGYFLSKLEDKCIEQNGIFEYCS